MLTANRPDPATQFDGSREMKRPARLRQPFGVLESRSSRTSVFPGHAGFCRLMQAVQGLPVGVFLRLPGRTSRQLRLFDESNEPARTGSAMILALPQQEPWQGARPVRSCKGSAPEAPVVPTPVVPAAVVPAPGGLVPGGLVPGGLVRPVHPPCNPYLYRAISMFR